MCVGWLYCTVVYVVAVFGALKGKEMFGTLRRGTACLIH